MKKDWNEILAAHADEPAAGRSINTELSTASRSEQAKEKLTLLDVAKRARRALKPVTMDPDYRARLQAGLILAAQHRQASPLLEIRHSETQWGWLLGAAAIGSAAGLIAVMWRSRSQGQKAESEPRMPISQ